MDPLYEEEEEIISEPESTMINPITFVLQFLAGYGWFLLGASVLALYVAQKLRPRIQSWKQAREDAEYHKDPDVALARMEAVQRAREKQQREAQAASERAAELLKEREEKRRAEAAERLKKYGTAAGRKLGSADDSDFMPLSASPSASYRAPKRSACGGGGCGR